MGIISDSIDRYHTKLFTSLAEEMDRLSEEEIFNKEGAKYLMEKYERLVSKTCNNIRLTEKDRNNWLGMIVNNYDSSLSKLISRYKSK